MAVGNLMADSPECPDYLQGSSEVWPQACKHWAGSHWCKLPGLTCQWRTWWLAELTEVERRLLAFKGGKL